MYRVKSSKGTWNTPIREQALAIGKELASKGITYQVEMKNESGWWIIDTNR